MRGESQRPQGSNQFIVLDRVPDDFCVVEEPLILVYIYIIQDHVFLKDYFQVG